ncbi:phage tail tape measure protein [Acinetobacter sp. MB5]|uniref:phage tail tape measure protein n=1 Tax=Acinetobacter sp. MB5 TaxID=2069438 RepID=UPI000DD0EA5D|nr:phage tail tape measure protein [Acinetobacter sp. MB5]
MKPLRLEILFGSKDKLSPALRLLVSSSKAAASATQKTRNELKKLNDQQKQIDGYIKQKKATEDSAKALQTIQTRIKNLRQEMARHPSDALSREFDKATTQARKLKEAHGQNQIKLQQLRTGLNQAGYSTHNLAQQQTDLTRRITAANSSIESQKAKLANLSRLQQSHNRLSTGTQKMAMYGAGATGTGIAALYQMRRPIEESKRVDIEQARIASLGLGQQSTEEAIKYAKAMKTFGTSTLDNLQLVRDGVTAFADVHHAKMVAPMLAKMKFANEAMYGNEHGAENEKKFMDMLKVIEMRNGLKSEKAFHEQANIIQQVITATGGRVQAEEWLNVIKTGGIAAKGMDNKAFYYKMEPLVQEMGGFRVGTSMMSAYQNLYQGRTTQRAAANLDKFGLIGDYSKVKHNKTGDLSYLDIGAIKGADLFKKDQFAWMEQVLVPALNAKGITKEGDVMDAIGSIFSNRTASNLFSQMYMQRNQIHKNAKLNEGANNIDQLDQQAQNTTAGKELEAKAKLHDAYLQFGQTILPIYTKALVMAGDAMQTFTGWMQKNPALAKNLGTGLLVVAAGLVAVGGTLALLSPLILTVLSLRLMLSTLSMTSTAVGMTFRLLLSPVKLLGGGLLWLGRMLLLAGQMMLANPMLLAVALIAGAAYLIYRNWAPIKQFFSELWTSMQVGMNDAWNNIRAVFSPVAQWFGARWAAIKAVFSAGIQHLSMTILNWTPLGLFYTAFASVMSWFGVTLPNTFTGFGQMIIQGLIKGLNLGFGKLKAKWHEIGSFMPDWMRKKMDIHSPSRVMAGMGHFIMQGLNVGLDRGFPHLKNKFNQVVDIFQDRTPQPQLSLKSRFSNAFSQLAQSNTPQQAFNPIASIQSIVTKVKAVQLMPASSKASRPIVVEGDSITVQIHAQQGHSVQDLVQQFEQFLQRREREKQARIRTRFFDDE